MKDKPKQNHRKDAKSQFETKHHERIVLTPISSPNGIQVEVRIETLTLINRRGRAGTNDNLGHSNPYSIFDDIMERSLGFLNPNDNLLLSILDKFSLDSLLISVSDSSTQEVSFVDDHDEHAPNVDVTENTNSDESLSYLQEWLHSINDENSSDSSITKTKIHKRMAPETTFPVGTSIQYKTKSIVNKDHQDRLSYTRGKLELVRSLSESNLLCVNVPVEAIIRNPKYQYTHFHPSLHNPEEIILIPNNDHVLCHTDVLLKQILSGASLCGTTQELKRRRKGTAAGGGVFSEFNHKGLNLSKKVVRKASWMKIHHFNNGDDNVDEFSIHRGIRYTLLLDGVFPDTTPKNDLGGFTASKYSSGMTLNQIMLNFHQNDGDSLLTSCPLAESSQLVLKGDFFSDQTSNDVTIHDLHSEPLDMDVDYITDISPSTGAEHVGRIMISSKVGIERNIYRSNGASNNGTFQTRIFYHADSAASCTDNRRDEVGKSHSMDSNGETKDGNCDVVNLNVVELYPKVVKPILHSLKITLVQDGENPSSNQKPIFIPPHTSNTFSDDQIKLSKDGSVQLSFATSLPPNSSLYITLDYSPRFLPFEHFPSDPNRGFDVAPSFATFTSGSSSFRVYSNSLLVMPPVPDTSMPFNVISLVSSFVALIIGSVLNILIRRASEKISDDFKGIKQKNPLQKLKHRFKEKFKRITGRQKGD